MNNNLPKVSVVFPVYNETRASGTSLCRGILATRAPSSPG